mmetsp:Transcript_18096/g.32728  ORF Transcript_18096/g.32728 Transcript_18096/m.32728 type:complete len:368 (-) Transcript_18096:418-1521(-)
MDSNQDKPSSSVKLNGFAAAAGSGAGSAFVTGPTAAAASASAAGGISSASTSTTPSASSASSMGAKKPPSTSTNAAGTKAKQRTNAKKKLHKGSAMVSSSVASSSETTNNNNNDTEEATVLRPLSDVNSDFSPLSLPQIQLRLKSLLEKLPKDLPIVLPPYDANETAEVIHQHHAPIKSFASTLQIAVEEYNLLLSLVSCATYRWGVDRSGASQQNLSVMSAELQQCQEVISNVVSARLSNVLCPAVDVVVGEVEIVRAGKGGYDNDDDNNNNKNGELATKKRKLNDDRLSNGGGDGANNERRINHYTRPLVDPSYVHLCHCILARNAPLIRHTVATSLYTAQRVIRDYLKAMQTDSSHDSSKGGYY